MKHLTLIAAAILSFAAQAADFSSLTAQGYVSDFASVLDTAHRLEIERYLKRVEVLAGAQVAIVTIPTLGNEPIEDVANSLYRRWGIGQKGKNEGMLLLLAVNDRRMRLEVGYGLEAIFPDGYAGQLLDAMRPLLRQREYGRGLLEAAHQIGTRIADSKNVKLDATIPSRRVVRDRVSSYLPMIVPLGVAGVVLLIFAMSRRNRRRYGSSRQGSPFFVYGPSWGGGFGGGGSSGGGFGGYDSSDSFGGFGGGDSGGGGSNSDW
ncbi:MAG: TPM domain-containing protein [Acidobacteria bacterium]|nr:TPM domain-containing protein [Acidobacteriota bacterium]